jgi:hypothetical protein
MPTPTHVWRPSSARVVVLDGFVPIARASFGAPQPPLAWAAKDPADVLDYQLDVTAAALGNEGDVITALEVAVEPANQGDLTVNGTDVDGLSVVLWLGAGVAGTTYLVTVAVTMASGRIIQRTVSLPVIALSSSTAAPDALQTDLGAPIVDQNGNPLLLPG